MHADEPDDEVDHPAHESDETSDEEEDEAGGEAPVPRGPFTRDNPLTFIVPELRETGE